VKRQRAHQWALVLAFHLLDEANDRELSELVPEARTSDDHAAIQTAIMELAQSLFMRAGSEKENMLTDAMDAAKARK
jgi:hypothetical protein